MTEIDTSVSYGVYRIVSPNGSCYIGMTTKSFDERWAGHRANFRNSQMTCIGLRRAFEKYTPDAMKFEVLEDLSEYGEGEILYRERLWWLRHKAWGVNLYNGEPTGRGAVRHTEETRKRIGAALKGRAPWNRPKDRLSSTLSKVCQASGCTKVFETNRSKTMFCSMECTIKMRKSNINQRQYLISSAELYDLYWVKGLSKQKIADQIGVHRNTVGNMLLDYDIPRRKIGRGA